MSNGIWSHDISTVNRMVVCQKVIRGRVDVPVMKIIAVAAMYTQKEVLTAKCAKRNSRTVGIEPPTLSSLDRRFYSFKLRRHLTAYVA